MRKPRETTGKRGPFAGAIIEYRQPNKVVDCPNGQEDLARSSFERRYRRDYLCRFGAPY
jgi:hypothetical protein